MKRFNFLSKYGKTELYKDYDQPGLDVAAFVRASPGTLCVLDFSGITFLGYSYSKAAVAAPIPVAQDVDARIVVYADDALDLDELSEALAQFKRSVTLLDAPDGSPAQGRVIGFLPDHLQETWSTLAAKGETTTADLATALGESLQNTNQRLKKLDDAGLIVRNRVTSPSGGWEWKNNLP